MGDSDEETYAQYGTALDPIEEDELPSKKPIRIQDQVATDERGRRRFHGAFTGGFSAGYFNTVGSKEGWAPSTFKSSRAERANVKQNASDYMDEEDKGAFGIAPHMLRTTSDFSTSDILQSRKRKREDKPSDGPIPGVPVLHQVLEPVKETVGIRMLIKMGWRPGQGIGPKLSKEDKKRIRNKEKRRKEKIAARKAELEKKSREPDKIEDKVEDQENKEDDTDNDSAQKMYGCSIPLEFLPKLIDNDDVSSSDEDGLDLPEANDILLAPDDIENPLCNPKENSFGHGYKGLDRNTILGGAGVHIDLFGASHSFKVGGNKNKLNITGEAFGIGAFENVDIDVYNKDDMGEYDFALETPEERKRRMTKEALAKASKKKSDPTYIVGFRKSTTPVEAKKYFRPPTLPENYTPANNPFKKRSRFETSHEPTTSHPIIQNQIKSRANKFSGVDQFQQQGKDQGQQNSRRQGAEKFQLSIQERGALLGEDPERKKEREIEAIKAKEISDAERLERLGVYEEALKKVDVSVQKANQISFKPFMKNPEKQARYEKYILLVGLGFKDCLKDLQPDTLLDWEFERERLEFERASTLYKPGNNVMSSRFVSAKSHDISHLAPEKENAKENDPTKDAKLAAKMKLFGKLTHRVLEWHPDKLVCKRMNIPSPYPNSQIVGLIPDHTASESRIIKSATSVAPFNQFNTTPAIEQQEKEIPQEQPKEKKSLFDNLDFSKPPPGIYPLDSFNPSMFAKPPPATGEDEPKPPGEEETAIDSTLAVPTEETVPLAPIRPSMDLFKEIFDASSSEESEDEEKDKDKRRRELKERSGSSSKKDYSQERYNKTQQHQQNKRDDRDRSSESSDLKSQDEKPSSIFQNLDLDRMNMSTKLLSQNQKEQKQDDDDHVSNKNLKKRKIQVDEDEHSFYYFSRKERETRQKQQDPNSDIEEQDDMYGPQVPKPQENSKTSSSSKDITSNRNSLTATSTDLLHRQKPVYPSSSNNKVVDEKDNIWIEKDALINRKHSSSTTTKSKKSKSSGKSHHKKSKKNKSKSHKSKKKSSHKKKSSKSNSKSSSNHKNKVDQSGSSSSSAESISDSDDSLEKSQDSEMEMAILAKLRGLRENKLI